MSVQSINNSNVTNLRASNQYSSNARNVSFSSKQVDEFNSETKIVSDKKAVGMASMAALMACLAGFFAHKNASKLDELLAILKK